MRNALPPSGLLPLASWRRILWVVAAAAASFADAAVYIDGRFSDGTASYESVAYFDLEDTPWKYVRPGEILTGPITVLTSKDFDDFFIDYQKRLILGDPKEQTNNHRDDWVPDDDFLRNATSPREDDDAVFAETTLRDEVAGLPPHRDPAARPPVAGHGRRGGVRRRLQRRPALLLLHAASTSNRRDSARHSP